MKRDPTKTLVLRTRAARQINKRFNLLKRAVRSAFSVGLFTNVELARIGQFNGLNDVQKLAAFDTYFHEQVEIEILRTNGLTTTQLNAENHWLNKPIGEGYRRGAVKMRLAAERNIPSLVKLPSFSPFANPAHVDRAQLIFVKSYSDLEGITQVMESQMSRILADGMLKGQNPKKVAKEMVARIDKIGKTRARMLSRTEIIESHNTASVNEAEILEEQTGVKIDMKWISAGDDRVRPDHVDRDGVVYTKQEARSLIGEPNCRCNITPVFTLPK